MRALDLFCGACGGWSLGLHRAGIETAAACEIDPWRRAVYSRNFPAVRLYEDVRELTAARLHRDGIEIDIIVGSPPCQDASTANTSGKGLDGERTGLFFEAVRLVGELRPRWCAFENVPGIRRRGVDRVLDALEREGYAVWPLVVGAGDLGAPHRRKRVWIVAADSTGSDGRAVRGIGSKQGASRNGLAHPNPTPLLGPALARDQSDGDTAGAPADADERAGESSEPRSAIGHIQDSMEESACDPPRDGRGSGRTGRPDPADARQQQQAFRDADRAGLALGEGEPGDDGAELAPLERAIAERVGEIAHTWNGGIAGNCHLDDGLPKGVARAALAAVGDSIVPQIAEMIARAFLPQGRIAA